MSGTAILVAVLSTLLVLLVGLGVVILIVMFLEDGETYDD
jgi:hypothetical protein